MIERGTAIWRLTWPQLSMLLCQFLIGITDVWASGRLGPEIQATVGLITRSQMVFMALAIAVSSGAVASISQSLGAGRIARARRFAGLATYGIVALGFALSVPAFLARGPFLELVRTPATLMPLALAFFGVTIWSIPGQYAMSIGGAAFRAAQMVKKPLYASLAAAAVNVAGDLAFGLRWWGFPACGAQGMAWSTLVAVTVGSGLMLGMLYRSGLLPRRLPPLRWLRAGGGYLIKVAAPAFGSSLLWQTGYLVLIMLTATLPREAVPALAGLSAGLQVEALLFLPAVAFNMTASVLVGHALGHRDTEEARRVMLQILAIACAAMSVVGLILWPFRASLAGFLSTDSAVQAQIIAYLSYNILSVPFTVASVVLGGVLAGAGATVYPMAAFSVSIWLVRLPLAWCLGHRIWQSADGIYFSMLVSQMLQSASLFWVVMRCDWTRFAMGAARLATRGRHGAKP